MMEMWKRETGNSERNKRYRKWEATISKLGREGHSAVGRALAWDSKGAIARDTKKNREKGETHHGLPLLQFSHLLSGPCNMKPRGKKKSN